MYYGQWEGGPRLEKVGNWFRYLRSFHESRTQKLHDTSSSSVQQVPVLLSTDGPQPEIDMDSNIPESKLLVPSEDNNTLGNEVIVEQSVFREEICGEFLLSGM